jgi:inner membrane protein
LLNCFCFIDSLTHIVLGACIGEAILEKKLGKRAMFLGALAQSIPDIDFIAAFWNDPASNLLVHRGFTHSLFFALIAVCFFGLLAEHFHRQHKVGFRMWVFFFAVEIIVHLFLDLFNNYGMGLWEPFNHSRISFNTIYVADPFFSICAGIAFVVLLILKRKDRRRILLWKLGITIPAFYLLYCVFNKLLIDTETRTALANEHIHYDKYLTTPTPLNNWLWYVVAGNKNGFYIGFRSVFDKNANMSFHYFPKNDSLLLPLKDHEEVQKLLRFSKGFYTIDKWKDTLVFNDLRFGQIVGWYDPNEHFVFHYFLQHDPRDNRLVVQRGRFANWNITTVRSLWSRIKGE